MEDVEGKTWGLKRENVRICHVSRLHVSDHLRIVPRLDAHQVADEEILSPALPVAVSGIGDVVLTVIGVGDHQKIKILVRFDQPGAYLHRRSRIDVAHG